MLIQTEYWHTIFNVIQCVVMSINFKWNLEKNKSLMKDRGVCFEDVVTTIYEDKIIDTIKHPNKEKYPDQSIYIVELMGYVCMVPYVKNDDEIYLKTIIPSRKMHKHYKGWFTDLDKYEQELLKDIENAESFEQVDNYADVNFETKLAAKNYLKKTKNINIRVAEYDILMLKRKSAEVNIPYQTILSSLIHQYVENKVNIKL